MLSWHLGSLRRKPSIDRYGEFRACRLSQINGAKIIFIQLPARVRFRFAPVHAVHRSKAWEPPGTISPNKSLCNHRQIGQKFWKRCEPPNLLNFSAANLYCFSLAHLVCYIFWPCALRYSFHAALAELQLEACNSYSQCLLCFVIATP